MEKIVHILSLLLIVTVTQNLTAQVNKTDANGKKQGEWMKTYPNSRAFEYKGQFKDDKPVGTFTYFYPSTKVKAIVKHDPNSTRSSAFMYHESGTVVAFGIYRSQKKDSVWTHFGPSGRLSYKETYKNGQLNGKKTIYYIPEDPEDKSERIAKIYTYKMDVIDGEVIEYFDSGSLKSKATYVNGRQEGIFIMNHPGGKPMIEERYKNGERHGWCLAFDEEGKEIGRKFYKGGKELAGKDLDLWLKYCKQKGLNPNN